MRGSFLCYTILVCLYVNKGKGVQVMGTHIPIHQKEQESGFFFGYLWRCILIVMEDYETLITEDVLNKTLDSLHNPLCGHFLTFHRCCGWCSDKYLAGTLHDFLNDLRSAVEICSITPQDLEEAIVTYMHDKNRDSYVRVRTLLHPVYLKLREMGYNKQELFHPFGRLIKDGDEGRSEDS